ncbi:hypothetical protein POM88_037319 [Heracleum sosnowskyi]|uniref:Uncharacterized protein n=1 Tax=Heracleum sosnowskyi TaxID=360622 RepID=A0AAD8HPW6_9APIA|nr:hypothetical protein POM88_037319 [Heracleum sosnowskyi]
MEFWFLSYKFLNFAVIKDVGRQVKETTSPLLSCIPSVSVVPESKEVVNREERVSDDRKVASQGESGIETPKSDVQKEFINSPAKIVRDNLTSDDTTSLAEPGCKTIDSGALWSTDTSVIEEGKKFSSQNSLSVNLENMKMKAAVGRPRKKTRSVKNPFDMGLSKRKMLKSFKNVRRVRGRKNAEKLSSSLPPITEFSERDSLMEAVQIVKCAEELGLAIQDDREIAVKRIASQLEDGTL